MGFFDKTVKNTTLVDETFNDYYTPVGVNGSDNRTVGAYGQDNSTQIGGPIAGSIGDEAFAPYFNFAGGNNAGSNNKLDLVTQGLAANPTTRNDLLAMLQASGDGRSPEQWLLDDLNAGDTNSDFLEIAKGSGALGRDAAPSASQFGGAVQGSGFNVEGYISAPIASGEDSFAAQVGVGAVVQGDISQSPIINAPVYGPVIVGDVSNSPIINAPIAGPATIIGGDVDGFVISPVGPVDAPIYAVQGDINAPIISPVGNVSAPITAVQGDVNAPIFAPSGQVMAPVTQIQGDVSAPIFIPTAAVTAAVTQIQGDNDAPIFIPAGPVTAPVSFFQGDNSAPVVNSTADHGSVSAPISSGGDLDISAPIISGVSGNVSITTADAEVAQAAIEAATGSLSSSLEFANKALAAVADSRRDPNEKVNSNAINALTWASIAFALISALS